MWHVPRMFKEDHPELCTWQTRLLNVVSGLALLIGTTWVVHELTKVAEVEAPPRIVNSITVEPTILLVGKPFVVHINVTLNKLCPFEVQWSLIRKSDNVEVVKVIEPIKQPPAAIGTQDLPPLRRFVPSSVEPGEYQYASEVHDLCGEGGSHTYTSVRRNVDLSIR